MVGLLKSIESMLNMTVNSQTHHRRREARGRSTAEAVNSLVMYWSSVQSLVLLVVAGAQVVAVRRFFVTDKQQNSNYPWSLLGLAI